MQNKWVTKDIVTLAVIAVVFGLLGAGWGYVWNLAYAVPNIGAWFSSMISFPWFITPLLAFYLIRKPGAAAFSQLLAGVVAILAGHPSGVIAFGWYAIQAVVAEAVFASFRYKRWDWLPMLIAAELCALEYAWGLFYYQIYNYGFAAWFWPWIAMFVTAWIAAPLTIWLGKALARTGLASSSVKEVGGG